MKLENLKEIINNSFVTKELVLSLNETFEKYEITTPLRVCHFLAQIIHESGGFKYKKEIASGEAYEGRVNLGNIYKGDGVKFKGRGLIQITGRNNYFSLSNAFEIDFINQPELLEQFPYAALSAGWYWYSRKLNQYADKDDINTITKLINGGYNGLADRLNWLNICKKHLLK